MTDDLTQLNPEELTLFNSSYPIEQSKNTTLRTFWINSNIVHHIKNTFMKVKGSIIEDHDISGQTLDIEKYMQYRLNKKFSPRENHDREFFNMTEDKQGLTVGVLIDVGILMNKNMDTVRNTIASIYKGLEIVPNIKLMIYTYTGDLNKSDGTMNLIIDEIKSLDDCKKIVNPEFRNMGRGRTRYYNGRCRTITGEIGTSPTFLAVDFITKKLAKVQQDDQKTTLIIITEGRPSSINKANTRLIDELTVQKLTYRSITKAQANNISTFAITLTSSDLAQTELNQMFKGHLANGYGANLEKVLLEKIDEFIKEANA